MSIWVYAGSWLKQPYCFGAADRDTILKQLSDGNRLILENGVRGFGRITFTARSKRVNNTHYIWFTNDERRQLIKRLTTFTLPI